MASAMRPAPTKPTRHGPDCAAAISPLPAPGPAPSRGPPMGCASPPHPRPLAAGQHAPPLPRRSGLRCAARSFLGRGTARGGAEWLAPGIVPCRGRKAWVAVLGVTASHGRVLGGCVQIRF